MRPKGEKKDKKTENRHSKRNTISIQRPRNADKTKLYLIVLLIFMNKMQNILQNNVVE